MKNYLLVLIFCILMPSWLKAADETETFTYHIGTEKGLSSDLVTDIAFDGNGSAWVATYAGVNQIIGDYVIAHKNQGSNLGGNQITKLAYNRKYDLMMLGTQAIGLMYYNFKTRSFEFFQAKNGLSDNHILDVKCDHTGRTWLLSKNGAISWFDASTRQAGKFKQLTTASRIDEAECINVDQHGNL